MSFCFAFLCNYAQIRASTFRIVGHSKKHRRMDIFKLPEKCVLIKINPI